MRMTSIATTVPAPLSVAPVADAHESRWPPTITTSSFSFGSVPGISATVSIAVLVIAGEFRFDIHLDGDRHVGLQQAIDAAVILNRHHDDGQGIGVSRACRLPSRSRRRCRRRLCRPSRRRRGHRGWAR